MAKAVLGSPVLIKGGDGRKAHLVDIVLCENLPGSDPTLVPMCFVRFDDGEGWWHGASHWLVLDPSGVHLTFSEHEHVRRLMNNLHVDTGKPLVTDHGKTTHKQQ